MASSRKRKHDPESEEEEGEMMDDSDVEAGPPRSGSESQSESDSDRKKKRRSKKSKKSSKKKKKKHRDDSSGRHRSSRKRSRRHGSDEGEVEDEEGEKAGDTDREGGSTPELPEVEEELVLEKPSRSGRSESACGSIASRIRDKLNKKQDLSSAPPEPVPEEGGALPDQDEGSSGAVLSMSVEDSNALRAKLGLPPLKMSSEKSEEATKEAEQKAKDAGGTLIPNSNKNEVHVPAKNLSEMAQAEKIREKIKQRRLKREQESKLLTLKKLGDSDSDDDTSNWVERQKKLQKEKAEAAKRARMLEEMDDEFGVSNLVEEEAKKSRDAEYTRSNLKGLKVEHSMDRFQEGGSVILTLKDADVLDDEAQDTLVNVNMVDDERTKKKLDEVRKAKVGYNAYDNEEIDELTGEVKRKNMLDKYDEEIDGEKKDSFVIGDHGGINEEERKERERQKVKAKLKLQAKTLVSLDTPQLKVASDYMTQEEKEAKFKKPKKKKKTKRQVLRADDLLGLEPETESFGSRKRSNAEDSSSKRQVQVRGQIPMDIDPEDSYEVKPDLSDLKFGVEDEDDLGLESALKKARRLQQKKVVADAADIVISGIKEEPIKQEDFTGSEFIATFEEDNQKNAIILNETAEFCRNLGARQVILKEEKRNNEDDDADKDLLDFENSLKSNATRQHEERRGRWAEVKRGEDSDEDMDLDYDDQPSTAKGSRNREAILDEEPDLKTGVAAAIKLANSKGYWEKNESKNSGSKLNHLKSQNYAIDDKMKDDDRGSRRDRHSGPTTTFAEKAGYKPNVKLEYVDDSGRMMNQKEAFRYLSHRFHGKGSGKMKTEKRMKKAMEEGLMKNMSSIDTPLQTVEKLRKKQEATATPYIVLSGNKNNPQDLAKF